MGNLYVSNNEDDSDQIMTLITKELILQNADPGCSWVSMCISPGNAPNKAHSIAYDMDCVGHGAETYNLSLHSSLTGSEYCGDIERICLQNRASLDVIEWMVCSLVIWSSWMMTIHYWSQTCAETLWWFQADSDSFSLFDFLLHLCPRCRRNRHVLCMMQTDSRGATEWIFVITYCRMGLWLVIEKFSMSSFIEYSMLFNMQFNVTISSLHCVVMPGEWTKATVGLCLDAYLLLLNYYYVMVVRIWEGMWLCTCNTLAHDLHDVTHSQGVPMYRWRRPFF